MSRQVLIAAVVIPAAGYGQPERRHKKGDVVELSAAEITAIGAGNLRAASTANLHDQLGEAFAVSNSSA
jgi:hypothetical protein